MVWAVAAAAAAPVTNFDFIFLSKECGCIGFVLNDDDAFRDMPSGLCNNSDDPVNTFSLFAPMNTESIVLLYDDLHP